MTLQQLIDSLSKLKEKTGMVNPSILISTRETGGAYPVTEVSLFRGFNVPKSKETETVVLSFGRPKDPYKT